MEDEAVHSNRQLAALAEFRARRHSAIATGDWRQMLSFIVDSKLKAEGQFPAKGKAGGAPAAALRAHCEPPGGPGTSAIAAGADEAEQKAAQLAGEGAAAANPGSKAESSPRRPRTDFIHGLEVRRYFSEAERSKLWQENQEKEMKAYGRFWRKKLDLYNTTLKLRPIKKLRQPADQGSEAKAPARQDAEQPGYARGRAQVATLHASSKSTAPGERRTMRRWMSIFFRAQTRSRSERHDSIVQLQAPVSTERPAGRATVFASAFGNKIKVFSGDEILALESAYDELVDRADSGRLTKQIFLQSLEKQVALDVDTHAVGERLWRICNPKAEGTTLEFADYVLLVGALVRGSAEVHATLVFEIFDLNDDGALRIDDMFVAMHQGFDDALRDDFAMLCNIAKAKIDAGRTSVEVERQEIAEWMERNRSVASGLIAALVSCFAPPRLRPQAGAATHGRRASIASTASIGAQSSLGSIVAQVMVAKKLRTKIRESQRRSTERLTSGPMQDPERERPRLDIDGAIESIVALGRRSAGKVTRAAFEQWLEKLTVLSLVPEEVQHQILARHFIARFTDARLLSEGLVTTASAARVARGFFDPSVPLSDRVATTFWLLDGSQDGVICPHDLMELLQAPENAVVQAALEPLAELMVANMTAERGEDRERDEDQGGAISPQEFAASPAAASIADALAVNGVARA